MGKAAFKSYRKKPVRNVARIGLLLMSLWVCTGYGAQVEDSLINTTPRFWTIDRWSDRVARVSDEPGELVDPTGVTVRALCAYYGIPFRRESVFAANPSPLAWPEVFAASNVNPRFAKLQLERLARYNSLAVSGIVVLDTRDLTDSLYVEVSNDHPVVLNHPASPVLYGYDRREPDAWWLVYRDGRSEVLFESERREEYMYWSDDPAANLAWAVTGLDTQSAGPLTFGTTEEAYQWLEVIQRSVRGDHERGIRPYPLSLRALRDSIGSSVDVPALRQPVDASDPLGIRRARAAREFCISLLERLSMQVVDTLESHPLRLALYFYHNSLASLTRLESLLYNDPHETLPPDRLEVNWRDTGRRTDAVKAVTDLLEWEKQAAEQIDTVVTRRSGARTPH